MKHKSTKKLLKQWELSQKIGSLDELRVEIAQILFEIHQHWVFDNLITMDNKELSKFVKLYAGKEKPSFEVTGDWEGYAETILQRVAAMKISFSGGGVISAYKAVDAMRR